MNTITISRLTTLAGAVALVFGSGAYAAGTGDQEVPYEITAINNITVAASSSTATINSAVVPDGSGNRTVNPTATWAIDTNSPDEMELSAELKDALPDAVTLFVTSVKPAVGATKGEQSLVLTTPVVVADNITGSSEAGIGLTYRLVAGPTAEPGTGSLTVTYTLAAE